MLTGVYISKKKDGTIYYRSNITYNNKHISLGSFPTEELAADAYLDALQILRDTSLTPESDYSGYVLSYQKIISLLNFRDNGIYMKTPIYIRNKYFQYFLSANKDLKFDMEDLFYYSSRTISQRGNHLFVADYGMQVSLASRYGIKNHAVAGKDYRFINGDDGDYRSSNLIIYTHYHGVSIVKNDSKEKFRTKIHINGDWIVGIYDLEATAAIAYNKAVDLAKKAGINKNFPINFIEEYSSKEYADEYTKVKISDKYLKYLSGL